MRHFLVEVSSFLLPLLVNVDRCAAIAVLLGFVGEFAMVCSMCGGDPGRSLKQGPTTKFTAAGCATTDGREHDVGKLRFSQ